MILTNRYSDDQISKNEMGSSCGKCGREERCIKDLVGRPEGKRILGRTGRGRENNIERDIQKLG